MRVVYEFPPLYDEIAGAFDLRCYKPIFSWGDRIFNPHRVAVDTALIAHEGVHGGRQGESPEAWWRRYIADPQFRLTEELLAHTAEYRVRCAGLTPNQCQAVLRMIARRLTSKLYGSLISITDAKIAIARPDLPFRTRLDTPAAARAS